MPCLLESNPYITWFMIAYLLDDLCPFGIKGQGDFCLLYISMGWVFER